MEPLLKLKDVSYSYHTLKGETSALKDISFEVNKGEFIAIVGPSGCGKSTLLSIIAGLIEPEDGEISLNDVEARMGSPDMDVKYDGIGYMLQKDHLFEWRTVYDNVTLGLEIRGQKTKEKISCIKKPVLFLTKNTTGWARILILKQLKNLSSFLKFLGIGATQKKK